MSDIGDHRLPRTVTPSRYRIELAPDLDAASFAGRVDIEVDVHEPTAEIVLNATELDIKSARVGDREVAGIATDQERERLTLTLEAELDPGPAVVSVDFTGVLNDKLRGFYRSTYTDDDGVERVIATTQFESTSARRAFPCWDEPDLKATFAVSLVVPDDLMALSAGPETGRESLDDGRVRVTFGETMVMSTYLLAFVVGPLEATEVTDVDGVALRVVFPRGKANLAPFAIDAGAFCLRFFTEYFGIPYPDKKLDLVGVPDFAFGAMENQGCIIFREALLLVDTETSSQPEQERCADVIAHEIAHMWFGNLVTMRWWNGIWLKEAFATFCETLATDAYRPDWQRWVSFGLARSAAFDVDALASTRAIEFDVISPDDAEAMYDILTYEKGAAVVRMLEQYLGADAFRDGVRAYLAGHSFGNTENHDLWESIQAATGQPARDVMDSWIFQGGYPLVSIERTGATTVRLSQERFEFTATDDGVTWHVPVVLRIGSGPTSSTHPVLLSDQSAEFDLGEPFEWVNANADGSGFYRVRYQGELGAAAAANHAAMPPIERYGLVDDAWAAFIADRIELHELLGTVGAIVADELDLAVWQRVSGLARSIRSHLKGEDRQRFSETAIGWARDALVAVGHEPTADEGQRRGQLRATLLTLAGTLGDPDTVAHARALMDDADTDPDRAAAAVSIVAANGTAADHDRFVAAMRSAATPQDERRYMFALPDFPDAAQIDSLLSLIEAGEIRSQDAPYVLGRGLANTAHGVRCWRFISGSFDDLVERFPNNSVIRMVGGVSALADRDMAGEILDFFESREIPQAGKTLDQHLERLRVNVGVRERVREQYVG